MSTPNPSPSLKGREPIALKQRAKQAFLDTFEALRQMARPVLAIQATAVLLVVAFYLSPQVREVSATLAKWNQAGGLLGAAITTVVASVAIPRIFTAIVGWKQPKQDSKDFLFELGYWVFIGVEIRLFYSLQSLIWGDAPTFATVAKKVAFDMLVFTACWNMPVSALMFLWRDRGFSGKRTAEAIKEGDLVPRIAAFIVGAVGFWLVMVSAIYSLPYDVQFVLFLLAQAAWALILLAMDRAKRAT